MAQRIEGFDVTFPPGTPVGNPVVIPTPFVDAVVTRIDVQVPDGPSGLMGWAILHSQQQIIPHKVGQYIVANNHDFSWEVEKYPTGALWAFQGYNTDVYSHTIHVQFLLDEIGIVFPSSVQLVPIV